MAETALDRSLRSGFVRSAAVTPDAPALVVKDVTVSYGELDARARRLAQALVTVAGGRASRVGVFAYRSETAYSGVLAALYSGAAFVPLNPQFPAARTQAMVSQAKLDAIVVDARGAAQIAALGDLGEVPILAPDADGVDGVTATVFTRDRLASISPLAVLPSVEMTDVAYLLFTSGTTGVPKGVPVTHANVRHFIEWATARYAITPDDRFSQTFDQTFDLSVFDLFVAWERGACVCVPQPIELLAPTRFAERHRLTVWFSVPSVVALLRKKNLLPAGRLPTLRWSLFCGEPLPRASAEAWQAAAPNSVVENLYGPTELTIACFVYRWRADVSPSECVNDIVPIGDPFPGLTAVVLNDALQPVNEGASGELAVHGPQTVPGYWHAPEKTAERFVTADLPGGTRERVYRTGDLVRRTPGEPFVYLGRVDHQVKVLGHRVELGEIEAVLGRVAGVTQAVALGWPVRDGSAEGIVAFVTGAGIERRALIDAARASLPDYMTPREVFVIDRMPLNVNGKIDRTALMQRLAAPVSADA